MILVQLIPRFLPVIKITIISAVVNGIVVHFGKLGAELGKKSGALKPSLSNFCLANLTAMALTLATSCSPGCTEMPHGSLR